MMSHIARLLFSLFLLPFVAAEGAAQDVESQSAFSMSLTGDWMPTRQLSIHGERPYLDLIGIMRRADVAVGNCETLFHDYEFYPMHQSGGIYARSDPKLVPDLVWTGLDMVSLANNHAGDYGVEAMRLTQRYLDNAGIVHAGVGESLREAREARFLDTPQGRVALISVASTFPDHSRASRSRDDIPARPGLNPLRFSGWFGVSEQQIAGIADALAAADVPIVRNGEELSFGLHFRVSDRHGVRSEPSESDVKRIARVVRSAHSLADYVIVSLHAHETGGRQEIPAEFIEIFARRMIDEGADVVMGHGPHVLRGIEIHRGKPIFYSLGNFVFQMDGTLRVPLENYVDYGLGGGSEMGDFMARKHEVEGYAKNQAFWESVLAEVRWNGKALASVTLHPITLWQGERTIDRGRPTLVEPEHGRKIIGRLAELSRAYGTEIEWRDTVGVVALPSL